MQRVLIFWQHIFLLILCTFSLQIIFADQFDQIAASSLIGPNEEGHHQIHQTQITRGENAGGNTVVIYKGPLRWAPLARAKAFGLTSSGRKTEEQGIGRKLPLPVEPAETISENNNDAVDGIEEGSGEGELIGQKQQQQEIIPSSPSVDYVDIEQKNGDIKNIRTELHESLRQPLRRLSDRQLSVLLKQIRKQRRQQQKAQPTAGDEAEKNGTIPVGSGNGNAEIVVEENNEKSRKEMLSELRELLRQPSNGRKLIRPKLLTNINIVPSEWSIYPPKRAEQIEENAENGDEKKNENVEEVNKNAANNTILKSTEIVAEKGEGSDLNLAILTDIKNADNETNKIEQIPPQNQIEEIQQINQTNLAAISEVPKIENATTPIEEITTIKINSRPGLVHAAQFASIENVDNELLEGNNALDVGDIEDEKSERKILKAEQKQQQQNESEERRRTDEKIAQLLAHWRVVEQKFAVEMETAMRTAAEALTEAIVEKEAKNKTERTLANFDNGNESKFKNNSNLLFSAKTWEQNSTNLEGNLPSTISAAPHNSEQFPPSNETYSPTNEPSSSSIIPPLHTLADLEAAELAELSTQLRKIRLRYETLKRQYLAKMRLLNERKLVGTKRLNKYKASAATTFIDGVNLELAGNKNGTSSENGTTKQTDKEEEEKKYGENLSAKQLERREEQRREEELARKALSSEIDEEIGGKLEGKKVNGGNETIKEEKIENDKLEMENESNNGENVKNGTTLLEKADELRGGTLNETATNIEQSLKNNNNSHDLGQQIGNNKTKSLKAGRRRPPKIKMPTLAELAEELNKLDESQIIGLNGTTGTADLGEEIGDKNENIKPNEFAKTSTQNSIKNATKLKTTKSSKNIPKSVKIVAEKNEQNSKQKIDKNEKIIGQDKNASKEILKNLARIENLSVSNNTSLTENEGKSIGTNRTNLNAKNNNKDELTAAQLEQDFLDQGEGNGSTAGLPSNTIRVIPTPRKRILTSDWLSQPNTRLMDFSKKNGVEKNEKANQKNLDIGLERKRGESRMKGTKNGNKNNGSKKVEENGQKFATNIQHQKKQRLTTTIIPQNSLNSTHSPLLNRTSKKPPKRTRVNQSASIGTRPPPPIIQRHQQIQGERRPIPPVQFQQQNVGQQIGNGPILGQQQIVAVNSGPTHSFGQQQKLKLDQRQGGFYQLDRTQVTNVNSSPKLLPQLSPLVDGGNGEFKLKGVAQVQVEASKDKMEEGVQKEDTQLNVEAKLSKEIDEVHNKTAAIGQNGKEKEHEMAIGGDDFGNLEEFARIDEQAICEAIACNFENGNLCEWEPSLDTLNPGDPRFKRYKMARRLLLLQRQKHRRFRRQSLPSPTNLTAGKEGGKVAKEKPNKVPKEGKKQLEGVGGKVPKKIVMRSWHNWVGQYRNRLTGIAKSDIFSTRNQRFAASYLRPGQRSALTGRLLSGEKATIRFRAWEATRDLQLRVCCEGEGAPIPNNVKQKQHQQKQCVFETDRGVKRGSRRWLEHEATCPQGTKKIIFECRNLGQFQGACGLDNIQLLNDYCPSITSKDEN